MVGGVLPLGIWSIFRRPLQVKNLLRASVIYALLSLFSTSAFAVSVGTCSLNGDQPLVSVVAEMPRCLGDCASSDPIQLADSFAQKTNPIHPIGPRCLYEGPMCSPMPILPSQVWAWATVVWVPTPDVEHKVPVNLNMPTGLPRYRASASQWYPEEASPPPRHV